MQLGGEVVSWKKEHANLKRVYTSVAPGRWFPIFGVNCMWCLARSCRPNDAAVEAHLQGVFTESQRCAHLQGYLRRHAQHLGTTHGTSSFVLHAMDKRAQIPVTLPRDNPTVSYWQDPPDGIADLRSTPDLPERAAVVIIGSGITGAAVAWNLLQSTTTGRRDHDNASIVMLEARQACSGATGRNGQFTSSHPRVPSPC